jgi:hypothetical protein
MSDNIMETETATDATESTTENQATSNAKTYTQEEFDNHMAGLKNSLTKRFEKQFQELGDIEELKQLKTKAEKAKEAEAIRKGEFEKILTEKAENWNSEIQKRDSIIKEYKINTPLLNSAAKLRSVNPEQVQSLLVSQVRLNQDGDVEVVGQDGTVRYRDDGKPLTPDELVKEFLDANPHFVQSTPATTNTKSSVSGPTTATGFDLASLDMLNPEHRKLYKEAKQKGFA